ncbi:unnamed protein product, partial [Mesorhabditis belari]|uniref:Uncharacterized protein n=1 Tax=Mesorhabditis belari TaxID=2138241 RepID=A0AAF3FPW2_9BILA
MADPEGGCLVARAVPCALPKTQVNDEDITSKLEKLSVNDIPEEEKKKQHRKEINNISPADYVTLQSIRSSALAKKTNTTSKFGRGGAALYADLLNKSEEKKEGKEEDEKNKKIPVEKAEDVEKLKNKENDEKKDDDKEESDGELLPRGPVRSAHVPYAHHPYMYGSIPYGTAAQSTVEDYSAYSAYGSGYECGSSWQDSPESMGYISNSTTPDTVLSQDMGYSSSPPRQTPFTDHSMSPADLNRLLNSSELPDALSDFILKYSRRYTATEKKDKDELALTRPDSTDSGCDSPLSAGSAPHNSPCAPRGGVSGPLTPPFNQRGSPRKEGHRAAKEKLRSLITDTDMDAAWAWTCKCMQYAPGALSYQDNDRDTLLHIVTIHTDLAKIYALVEQQLKTNYPRDAKPFDLPNRFHETPLFLAVEKRRAEVVAYLLEAGANPNAQTLRPERECAIHYAASRGMNEIVKTLCSNTVTDVNKMNGMGSTALLCAIRNHGVLDEESRSIIDNKETIRELLRSDADAFVADATNGKTVIHYAVERMNAELIEIFKEFLSEEKMTELVNVADLCGETPMQLLQQQRAENPQAQQLRSNLFLTLTICGAEIKRD